MDTNLINRAFKYAVWAIPATILLLIPSFTDPINLPKVLALIPLTTAVLVLFVFLRKYGSSAKNWNSEKYVVGLYAFLGLGMVITGFFGTDNYVRALFGTTGRNNGLIYYLCAITLATILILLELQEIELKYLVKIISATSVLFGIYATFQYLNRDPISWTNPYNRVIGTLGNPNFSSSALALFSILWLYRFIRENRKYKSKRSFLLLNSVWMALLSWSTESIQGLLVLGIGACLIFYVYIRERNSSRLIPYLSLFGGGTILTLLFLSFLGLGPLGAALEQYTLKLRAWYAFFGVKAMFNSPLTGIGVDNYVSAFRLYRNEDFIGQYGSVLINNNAHSTPVQVGASFGLFVFVIYCAIHLLILYRALKIINSQASSNYTNYLKMISILWVLVFAQSLLSIEIIGLGMMNWILGAIILSQSRNLLIGKDPKTSKEFKREKLDVPAWTGPLTIGALLVGTFPTILMSIEDKEFQRVAAIQVIDEESRLAVQQEYSKLSDFTLYYPDKVDQILGNLALAGLNKEVEQTVKKLYQVEPEDVYSADLLATFYNNTSQFSAELLLREKMQRMDPWNKKLELALAKAYRENDNKKKLEASITRLYKIAPESLEYQEAMALLDTNTSLP